MARLDNAVGVTIVTGAAASLRVRWPLQTEDTGGAAVTGILHLGAVPSQTFVVTSYAAGTEVQNVFAGKACASFQSTAAAGNGFGLQYAGRAGWYTELTGGPVVEDMCCWSIRATLAYEGLVGASLLDHGLFIYAGNNQSMFANGANNAGVQFGATGPAEVRLRAIQAQGGGVTVNAIVAPVLTPNIALYNTYELRVITGNNVAQPQLFGLINGQVATPRFAWGAAAALLPGPAAKGGGFFGYNFGVLNISSANVPNLHVAELCITAAQSEKDLF